MTSATPKTAAIVRARQAAAGSLVETLRQLPSGYSEKMLAEQWLAEIARLKTVLPFGWYQPPPAGMSVLIANPPSYERLAYKSLREEVNWPSATVHNTEHSILYPYYSAIDRETGLIGDFVATFYGGSDKLVRDWMREVYLATLKIIGCARPGLKFSELFHFAEEITKSLGASNNTYSLSGGLSSDIGHTVPWF